jgi:hypothetical protein
MPMAVAEELRPVLMVAVPVVVAAAERSDWLQRHLSVLPVHSMQRVALLLPARLEPVALAVPVLSDWRPIP